MRGKKILTTIMIQYSMLLAIATIRDIKRKLDRYQRETSFQGHVERVGELSLVEFEKVSLFFFSPPQ